jgi:hypothetical protein
MSEQLQTLNAQIIAAHEAHYKNAPEGWNGLIDCRNSSPNGNIIYHLYSTGEITSQKGAWAYLDRSEFTILDDFMPTSGLQQYPFKFPKKARDSITYAILTYDEAKMFREKMLKIYNLN